jgi:hypothetical protein
MAALGVFLDRGDDFFMLRRPTFASGGQKKSSGSFKRAA